jgi:hypothetical protein
MKMEERRRDEIITRVTLEVHSLYLVPVFGDVFKSGTVNLRDFDSDL